MAKRRRTNVRPIPKDESKAARFIRVVTPRVNKAVKAIKQIGFCSASNYEYTSKQLDQIVIALDAAQNEIVAKFAGKKEEGGIFDFKD